MQLIGAIAFAWGAFQLGAVRSLSAASVLANDAKFGYDATPGVDNAPALQAAINHGIETGDSIHVPDVEWTIGKPISIRDVTSSQHLKVILAPGVLIEAQSGQFRGAGDKLFTIQNSSNVSLLGSGGATIRMQKSDYQMASYTPSEFRHAIHIAGGNNIQIAGLHIEDSGGDGVYIGPSAISHCRNVSLRNLVVQRSHRNALSIVSVENVLVESCTFRDTSGTPPGAGIDIEPNIYTDVLKNIVLRNNEIDSNQVRGLFFSIGAFNRKSLPFDITVENTHIRGGAIGIGFAESGDLGATGTISIQGGSISGTSRAGIYFLNRAANNGVAVRISDVPISGVATNGASSHPIELDLGANTPVSGATGAVTFANISIVDELDREFLFATTNTRSGGVKHVRGTFSVKNPRGVKWNLGTELSDVDIKTLP